MLNDIDYFNNNMNQTRNTQNPRLLANVMYLPKTLKMENESARIKRNAN